MPVIYLTNAYTDCQFSFSPVKRRLAYGCEFLPGQSDDGYGRKMTTDYVASVVVAGRLKRLRVYATCFSNVASHWVLVNGDKLFVKEFDIPDSVRYCRDFEKS